MSRYKTKPWKIIVPLVVIVIVYIAIIMTCVILFMNDARADSLVCNIMHNGEYRTLIYTEVYNPTEPLDVKTVTSGKSVTFKGGGVIRFYTSNVADCTFIVDKIGGPQTALKAYLRQANPQ